MLGIATLKTESFNWIDNDKILIKTFSSILSMSAWNHPKV